MIKPIKGAIASRAAAVGAVAVVAFAFALAIPALRGTGSASPTEDGTPAARGTQQVDAWLVESEVTLGSNRVFTLDVRLTRDLDAPAPDQLRPRVIVEMDGMSPLEPPLQLTGVGEYRLEGVLPMSGRWTFRVGFGEEFLNLVVDVPPDVVGEAT